jgi:Zn finger protein HypA/HybF involved in hydrogenase expression
MIISYGKYTDSLDKVFTVIKLYGEHMTRRYTDQELIEAVKTSVSKREILGKLGLAQAGGNYDCLAAAITRLQLDTTHLLGKGSNKGKTFKPKRDIHEYLSNDHYIQSHKLKLRLIKENLLDYKCYNCNQTTWLNNPIPLELEHIDGNHLNNALSNLTLLCPNCHALTDTYRGKNKKNKNLAKVKTSLIKEPIINYCLDCNTKIARNSTRCKRCAGKLIATKITWPSLPELLTRLELVGYTKLGKELGVSDNAIRQHIKRHS